MRENARLLLVFAPSQSDPLYTRQRELLDSREPDLEDRDLEFVPMLGDSDEPAEARRRYAVEKDGFTAILVGRDGGEKFRSDDPIPAGDLFARIDAMPMRRREMREQD